LVSTWRVWFQAAGVVEMKALLSSVSSDSR
jgi:hypothetical protein